MSYENENETKRTMKTTLSYLSSFESFEIAPRVFYGLLLADIIALSLAARAFGLL